MKKKIFLSIMAILMMFALAFTGCGNGDDDTNGGDVVDTVYTVTFDLDGGNIDGETEIASITVAAGRTMGANYPDDPVKISNIPIFGDVPDDFLGWFDGETKYTASTPITKDVDLKASYKAFERPGRDEPFIKELGSITWNNSAAQRGWRVDGTDGTETDLPLEDFTHAHYLVLELKDGASATGYGRLDVVLQGDGNWDWSQTTIITDEDPLSFDRTVTHYMVIDLATLKSYPSVVRSTTQAKFLLANWTGANVAMGIGLKAAYLTNIDLSTKPTTGTTTDIEDDDVTYGYVTTENILEIAYVTMRTVNFDGNGFVDDAIPAYISVPNGKGMGTQYPYFSRVGWDFLGWWTGSAEVLGPEDPVDTSGWGTQYDGKTPITGNVNLTAGWKEQVWPDDPNPPAISGYTKKWTMASDKPPADYKWEDAGGHDAQLQIGRWGSADAFEDLLEDSGDDEFVYNGTKATLRIFYAITVSGNAGDNCGAVGDWDWDSGMPVPIPDDAPDGNFKWYDDYEIDSDFLFSGIGSADPHIIVNLGNGIRMIKVELWVKDTP